MARDPSGTYIHGTMPEEQQRLAMLNDLINRPFVDFLEIGPGGRVLEIGSGLGIVAHRIAAANPGAEVTGIEISSDQLTRARTDFGNTPNLTFLQRDATSPGFDDGSFDVVYCRCLLEHVPAPERVLAEAYRLLKQGGRIFVQENNIAINVLYPDCLAYERVWEEISDLQSKLGGDAAIGKKLFALLVQTGFRSVIPSVAPEVHYFGLPSFLPWINNLISIIEGAKDRLVHVQELSPLLVDHAVGELHRFRENPLASAYFYWNRASGSKA